MCTHHRDQAGSVTRLSHSTDSVRITAVSPRATADESVRITLHDDSVRITAHGWNPAVHAGFGR
ncbi:hypothetical protein GCM10022243_60100 [Saccharothrix violaceirubra]|uniref:Uncharacterized protein n=1 Tax=Saccharothrix violaceirubra TaxID=413306 RepID=A0A7W7T7I2_9PSEU|nr:hypothetical protein [Saccharothrix violaceirubra]MBB4967986.1 hypothetical protein [Saccharothrix violaceirubra]